MKTRNIFKVFCSTIYEFMQRLNRITCRHLKWLAAISGVRSSFFFNANGIATQSIDSNELK